MVNLDQRDPIDGADSCYTLLYYICGGKKELLYFSLTFHFSLCMYTNHEPVHKQTHSSSPHIPPVGCSREPGQQGPPGLPEKMESLEEQYVCSLYFLGETISQIRTSLAIDSVTF